MSPSNNETGMQLPPPIEQAPMDVPAGETASQAPEQAAAAPETAPRSGQQAPAMVVPPLVMPVATQPQGQASPATPVTQSSGTTADDGDLIEKEWVHKAKQIVERTRDDPYKQTEELTLVKVDYMKKRYGKTLKLSS